MDLTITISDRLHSLEAEYLREEWREALERKVIYRPGEVGTVLQTAL